MREPWFAVVLVLLAGAHAEAHPVAQGSLELRVRPGAIEARIDIANEEVFVASTFTARGGPPQASLEGMWNAHAAYVLAHLRVSADGIPLAGELRGVMAPGDRTATGLVRYELRFALPQDVSRPARIVVVQDLLREIEFAPGNPWEATFVARLVQEDRVVADAVLLSATQPIEWRLDWSGSGPAQPALAPGRIVRQYVRHGIQHILGGWDHLLFMSALVLAVTSVGDLIAVVTAFTLAHTVTLTLATLRIASVPSRVVEPMIAASIVAVAGQNLVAPRQTRGWPRLAVAFGFGLFHGLGFAGGLLMAMRALPGVAIATAIAAFSVGVEIGHQVVVLPLFAGVASLRRLDARRLRTVPLATAARRIGSTLVLVAGLYYLVLALRTGHG